MKKVVFILISIILFFFLYKYYVFYSYKNTIQEIDTYELREKIVLFLISKDCNKLTDVSELKKFIKNCHVEGGEQFLNLEIEYSNNILYCFGFDRDNDNLRTVYKPNRVNFFQSIFKNGDNILFDCSDLHEDILNYNINVLYKISENGIEEERINSFNVYEDQLNRSIKLKKLDIEEKSVLIKIEGDSIIVTECDLSENSIKIFKEYFRKYINSEKDHTIYMIRLKSFNIEDLEVGGDSLK